MIFDIHSLVHLYQNYLQINMITTSNDLARLSDHTFLYLQSLVDKT